MPIKKSAKKYLRVTKRKTQKNIRLKGIYRGAHKKTLEFADAGKIQESQEWLKKSLKALDKAAQKKVLHKNTAARKKSRLNAKVKNLLKK
jgi:small subunit ribosomal protein S20